MLKIMDFQNIDSASAADAAAGVLMSLPFHCTRDQQDESTKAKKLKTCTSSPLTTGPAMNAATEVFYTNNVYLPNEVGKCNYNLKNTFSQGASRASSYSRKGRDPALQRAARLEQNRRAAKDSRQRKNRMISDLQGSVVFFSRANSTISQQNDELSRLVMEAKEYITDQDVNKLATDSATKSQEQGKCFEIPMKSRTDSAIGAALDTKNELTSAKVTSVDETSDFTSIQPGSTMQEMACF